MSHSNIKRKCEKCNRMLCIRHFKNGECICESCKKKEVTNPFYIPKEKRKNQYGLTQEEKLDLFREHKRNGLSEQDAWHGSVRN